VSHITVSDGGVATFICSKWGMWHREIQGKLKRYHAMPSIIQNHRRMKLLPLKQTRV